MSTCEIYNELLSFSEKPRETAIELSRAQARIVSISGEPIEMQFFMYLTFRSKSSGRALTSSAPSNSPLSFSDEHRRTHQIQQGYPGIQHSGNAMSSALFCAASLIRSHVFLTPAARSSHAGSAWVPATRTLRLVIMSSCGNVEPSLGRSSVSPGRYMNIYIVPLTNAIKHNTTNSKGVLHNNMQASGHKVSANKV